MLRTILLSAFLLPVTALPCLELLPGGRGPKKRDPIRSEASSVKILGESRLSVSLTFLSSLDDLTSFLLDGSSSLSGIVNGVGRLVPNS